MQHQLNAKNNNANLLLVIFGILIFAYTCTRACLLSITWDEAYTYLNFVRNRIVVPETVDSMSANNHLLNTWLDIFIVNCFGVNELALRLPSLLGHILFLFYSAKFVKGFQTNWLVVASFLILNLNPYLLDFFSLARGYALSWGLMMASMYYLYKFISKEQRVLFAILSIVLSVFATLANFVLLNYCLALYAVIGLLILYRSFNSKQLFIRKIILFLKDISLPSIILIVFLGMIIPYVLNLKDAGALFWGGHISFWTDTISETINRNFYELGYNRWIHWLLKGFLFFILFAALAFIAFKQYKKQNNNKSLFIGSILLLIGFITFMTIIQHAVFATPYLTNRTALFFVILFNLLLVFFVNELSKEKQKMGFITYLTAFIMLIHFVFSFNLKYTLDWKSDADTKSMITELEERIKTQKTQKQVKTGISGILLTGVEFYLVTKQLKLIRAEEINKLQLITYDYLYVTGSELNNNRNESSKVIKIYPFTGNVLLLNEQKGE